ncbi:hypothetical protein B0H13DRAFT_1892133 [Mycena leptocephala]|nr:hypothetical protein B0H13DRAFT_1892133 [Mycena leptocephala]
MHLPAVEPVSAGVTKIQDYCIFFNRADPTNRESNPSPPETLRANFPLHPGVHLRVYLWVHLRRGSHFVEYQLMGGNAMYHMFGDDEAIKHPRDIQANDDFLENDASEKKSDG